VTTSLAMIDDFACFLSGPGFRYAKFASRSCYFFPGLESRGLGLVLGLGRQGIGMVLVCQYLGLDLDCQGLDIGLGDKVLDDIIGLF